MTSTLMTLEIIVGYLICALVAIFGLAVAWRLITGRIDLTALISESTGQASMSRFQLLIFTFVIALSFFFVTVSNVKIRQSKAAQAAAPPATTSATTGVAPSTPTPELPALPEVPGGVLAVLGISASSYLVSKGIQSGKDTELQRIRTGVAGPEGGPVAAPPGLIK